jgi:glycosyltransferase involved in cell wall biosynthesis
MQKKISVCIAVYNGKNFIKKQLESILIQLNEIDEIIIVDDCSTDNTISIINSFNDKRIKLFELDKNIGHVKAFNMALTESTGDIIFLSDQDDFWEEQRVSRLVFELINNNAILVNSTFGDVQIQGEKNISKYNYVGESDRIKNIFNIILGKVPYFGNTFCFNVKLKMKILPIPNWVEAHDLYIGLMANILGNVVHYNEVTIYRTIHKNNLTVKNKRNIFKIIKSRLLMLLIILKGFKKIIV